MLKHLAFRTQSNCFSIHFNAFSVGWTKFKILASWSSLFINLLNSAISFTQYVVLHNLCTKCIRSPNSDTEFCVCSFGQKSKKKKRKRAYQSKLIVFWQQQRTKKNSSRSFASATHAVLQFSSKKNILLELF